MVSNEQFRELDSKFTRSTVLILVNIQAQELEASREICPPTLHRWLTVRPWSGHAGLVLLAVRDGLRCSASARLEVRMRQERDLSEDFCHAAWGADLHVSLPVDSVRVLTFFDLPGEELDEGGSRDVDALARSDGVLQRTEALDVLEVEGEHVVARRHRVEW